MLWQQSENLKYGKQVWYKKKLAWYSKRELKTRSVQLKALNQSVQEREAFNQI